MIKGVSWQIPFVTYSGFLWTGDQSLIYDFCDLAKSYSIIGLHKLLSLGILRKDDDDDGSENVGKKMNLRSFKLNRVYLDPLNMSNTGDLSWSWILKDFIQVQKEVGTFVVVCPRLE